MNKVRDQSNQKPTIVNGMDKGKQLILKRDLGICKSCKLPISKDQVSIEVVAGVLMHYSCLSCGKCGVSLQDVKLQSLVRGDMVICNNCDKTFFPNCQKCKKKHFQRCSESRRF
jgi:hypothetical protein